MTKIRMNVTSFPKSYRHLIDDGIFLDDTGNNIAAELIRSRFITAFADIQMLLEGYGLTEIEQPG